MDSGIFGSSRRTGQRLDACKVPHRAMYPKEHSNGFEKRNLDRAGTWTRSSSVPFSSLGLMTPYCFIRASKLDLPWHERDDVGARVPCRGPFAAGATKTVGCCLL